MIMHLLRKKLDIEVYPNPTNEFLQIYNKSKDLYSIYLYDLSGRKIFQNKLNGYEKKTANITFLDKGIYILRIEQNGKIDFIKIMKK